MLDYKENLLSLDLQCKLPVASKKKSFSTNNDNKKSTTLLK